MQQDVSHESVQLEVMRRLELERVSEAYRDDSRRSRRLATLLYVVMALLVVAAVASSALAVNLLDGSTPEAPQLVQRLLVSLICLVSLIPFWIQAERHRRSASEFRRLELQFRALDPYLGPLPEDARAVMRAALAPRLFSRVLEDQDPMREPIWPASGSIGSNASEADHRGEQAPMDEGRG